MLLLFSCQVPQGAIAEPSKASSESEAQVPIKAQAPTKANHGLESGVPAKAEAPAKGNPASKG